ncbi:endolytic transglycosylase MltG [Rathayibacter sp. YIM 133350]|uniref:endolytic transglycosylase MltG n=1 Tax=Rathayibacter sp. YIM 133350 TaxID=3131992 RepID=UPI00307F09EA
MSNDTRSRHGGDSEPRDDAPGDGLNWDELLSGTSGQKRTRAAATSERGTWPTTTPSPAQPVEPPEQGPAALQQAAQPQPRSRREARELAAAGIPTPAFGTPAVEPVGEGASRPDVEGMPAELADVLVPTGPVATPSTSSRAQRRQRTELYPERERPRRSGAVGCLIAVLVLVALGVGGWIALQGPIQQFASSLQGPADYSGNGTGSVTVQIKDGDIGEDVAKTLHTAGVTASTEAFYKLLLAQSPAPVFQPGTYELRKKMSAASALAALEDPKSKLENTVLVHEGDAAPEVYQQTADALKVPLADVQAAAADPASFGLPAEATSLEGFLFPATYTFDPGTTPQQALKTMVDRSFQALDSAGVPPEARWKTVVLASIVQREAGSDTEDFGKVARVFQNRLDEGMLLQSDATVAYGTGNTDTVWTTDAERADAGNPYNTYVHAGLPVGPIGNPGDVAIQAALHPTEGDWLFFVPVNLATGETVFSTTEAEHEAAVQRLHDWCAESAENEAYCQ